MTWVLKSEIEIEIEAKRIVQRSRSPVAPLIVGSLFGLATGTTFILKYGDHLEKALVWSLISFSIAFIISYLIQIIRKRRLFKDKTFLCDGCYKSQIQTHHNLCECGGKILPIEYFNWVEDA